MPARQHRGFTLIELMIVVGIIGILAAIAIPAYQDYIARAQASEGVLLLASAKTPLAEFYADQGRWPASAGSVITVTAGGRYVIAGFVLTGAGTTSLTMTLEATFRPDNIARSIASKKLDLETNDGAKTWACHPSAVGGVAPQYLPGACK